MLFSKANLGADLFLDVGANIGYYSILAAKTGAARDVIAFEPDRRNLLQLGANVLMNGLADVVRITAAAVSSQAGKVRFVPGPDRSTGQSKVDDGAADYVEVDAIRIDDLIDLEGGTVIVKMDIEGHELEAVAGMTRLISKNDAVLQIECYEGNIPLLKDALAALGAGFVGSIEHDFFFATSPARAEALAGEIAGS